MLDNFTLPVLSINEDNVSIFTEKQYPQLVRGGMILTDQIPAINVRLRESEAGYKSDWHVAGDPTLIIIQQGTLRICLRNGDFKDFSSGEAFIAEDYMAQGLEFDNHHHGHCAEVIGRDSLKAVHIKLNKR